MNLLDLDARWRRFNDPDRACPCCGRTFSGIFDIGFDEPDSWPHPPLAETGTDDLSVGEDRLTADLCRIDGDRFIRCVLPLPIRGSDEVFFFGVWARVGDGVFFAYLDAINGTGASFDGAEAWIMNDLPLFESDDPIAATLSSGDAGARPVLSVRSGPLADAQKDGISFDHLLDIYAASGTDIRPHLTTD
ncbi:DUF2199 domain-containing protein [Shimia sp. SDUM112013]|uniref:DUF2199 domain-containing protein n=1 Tax=Shimia sp. SDUM112013 TaxID=3136160 RepID=UPI0032EE2A76